MDGDKKTSAAARTLGALGAAKGGEARAAKLPPEQRQEIARAAALARWGTPGTPRATHDGMLKIGGLEIPCAVLGGGRRVLSETGVLNSLGMYRSGAVHVRARDAADGAHLPLFAAHKNLQPFVDADLADVLRNPIWYLPTEGGTRRKGVDATLIPKICDVWLKARDAGVVKGKRQLLAASRADMLMRGLAHVGIIALVDEATGYQEVRDRMALQAILDKYLRKEFAAWAKRFPDEFYMHIFRLRGWTWKGMKVNRPQVVANYTKDIVYARLAPGILRELEARNIKDEKGYRKAAHHQWLTEDVGHPALAQHLYAVVGLMRIAGSWDEFKRMLDRAYPKRGDSVQMDLFGSPA